MPPYLEVQGSAQGALEWQSSRVSGNDPLAVRSAKKLKSDGQLITLFHPTALRLELDKIPLWRGNHVGVKRLVEDFASYLYLQRPRDSEVLLAAIREGIASTTWQTETFAFVESFDEKAGRYLAIRAGRIVAISTNAPSLIVKPDRAVLQLAAEEAATSKQVSTIPTSAIQSSPKPNQAPGTTSLKPSIPTGVRPSHFFGTVVVDAQRINRDVGAISAEIVQHLAKLSGATVKVVVEIQADVPNGFTEEVVRTVSENCRTLKFTSQGFETE